MIYVSRRSVERGYLHVHVHIKYSCKISTFLCTLANMSAIKLIVGFLGCFLLLFLLGGGGRGINGTEPVTLCIIQVCGIAQSRHLGRAGCVGHVLVVLCLLPCCW